MLRQAAQRAASAEVRECAEMLKELRRTGFGNERERRRAPPRAQHTEKVDKDEVLAKKLLTAARTASTPAASKFVTPETARRAVITAVLTLRATHRGSCGVQSYSALLRTFAENGASIYFERAWAEAADNGVAIPGAVLQACILRGVFRRADFEFLRKLENRMVASGTAYTVPVLTRLVVLYAKLAEHADAARCVQLLKGKSQSARLDAKAHDAMAGAAASLPEAASVVRAMGAARIRPSCMTYFSLLHVIGTTAKNPSDTCSALLAEMREREQEAEGATAPDIWSRIVKALDEAQHEDCGGWAAEGGSDSTLPRIIATSTKGLNAVMKCHSAGQNHERLHAVLEAATKLQGIRPDAVTFSLVIRAEAQRVVHFNDSHYREAEGVFEAGLSELGFTRGDTVFMYKELLEMYASTASIRSVTRLLNRMHTSGVRPLRSFDDLVNRTYANAGYPASSSPCCDSQPRVNKKKMLDGLFAALLA
ncbi:hypothetical protein DIPPA_06387 [Diplonema papillatum]|nr:hypothetical protein DIPPA_06387 [Diplonema papillatum]